MLTKTKDRVFSTVLGAIAVAVLSIIFIVFGVIIDNGVKYNLAQTQQVEATFYPKTSVDTDDGFYSVGYGFSYQGRSWCTRGRVNYTAYQQGLRTGKVTVWFDPNNPMNSSLQKPNYLLLFVLIWLPKVLTVGSLTIYALYLNSIWKYNKVAQPMTIDKLELHGRFQMLLDDDRITVIYTGKEGGGYRFLLLSGKTAYTILSEREVIEKITPGNR
jgi:hypothetical protein